MTQELQILKNKYDIIGNDPAFNRALEIAVAVAPTEIPVLVTGETGVGKEKIPMIIHQNSRRKNGKYVAVNCGAIPEGTMDSELFGHEKGSFTGAYEMRKGYFEEANGGTLFLDEIGELPLASQAKLLRVLQSGEFMRVGSSKTMKTDVRVVAATNLNLLHAVSKGKFRADLFYRLNSVIVSIPSLRERPGDINLLFRKFASDFAVRYGSCKVTLTEDASIILRKYRWPGNVRELQGFTDKVSTMEALTLSGRAEKCEIDAMTLAKYLPKDDKNMLPAVIGTSESHENSVEREAIIRSILQLRQDVDYLKDVVAGGLQPRTGTPAISAPEAPVHEDYHSMIQDDEDPEEQFYDERKTEDMSIKAASMDLIERVLRRNDGNRKAAAAELGISERTLYRKIKQMTSDK